MFTVEIAFVFPSILSQFPPAFVWDKQGLLLIFTEYMVEIFDNIRKIYTFAEPCAELSPYIDFFSESSFEDTQKFIMGDAFSVKMFASWTPTCYINLGVPYQLITGNICHEIGAGSDVLIIRDEVVERRNTAADHIFTIKFKPGGLEAVLGVKQPAIAGTVTNLSTVIPAAVLNRAKRLGGFVERKDLMQDFLLAQWKERKGRNYFLDVVQNGITLYTNTGMGYKNDGIAEKLFTTTRSLGRYFNGVIGTSPKNFFSIVRARAALTAYIADRNSFVPFDYGYYDFSHFSKSVKKFTGHR